MLSPHRKNDFMIKTIEALSSPIAPAPGNRVSYPARVTQTSVELSFSFQIASVDFSSSFELASIVLNSSAKEVAVQLPGAHSVEGAVRFEIVHVQLGSSGEIGMMQLNLLDQGPTRSAQVCDSRPVAHAIETDRLENALGNVINPSAMDLWMRTRS